MCRTGKRVLSVTYDRTENYFRVRPSTAPEMLFFKNRNFSAAANGPERGKNAFKDDDSEMLLEARKFLRPSAHLAREPVR